MMDARNDTRPFQIDAQFPEIGARTFQFWFLGTAAAEFVQIRDAEFPAILSFKRNNESRAIPRATQQRKG